MRAGVRRLRYPPLSPFDDGGVPTSDRLTFSFADFKLS